MPGLSAASLQSLCKTKLTAQMATRLMFRSFKHKKKPQSHYYLLLDAENLDDTAKGDASSFYFAIHVMVFFLGSMEFLCLRAVTRMPV